MKTERVYALPNALAPNRPVIFDAAICTGCNICVETCPMDVLIPNFKRRCPPLILHPDECWYCGCCVMECRKQGAITLNLPLMQRVRWKRINTGGHYRV